MTTGSIAARIQAKSGADLTMAAAANLALSQGKTTFTRKELTTEMRTATSYFKETYVSNFTATLHTLTKEKKLNEPSNNTFALTAAAEQELRTKLAQ